MQLNAVVFPAPFGPMRPTISHSLMRIDRSSSARRPPKWIERSRTSSTDMRAPRLRFCARRVVEAEPAAGEPPREWPDHLSEPAGVHHDGLQQQDGTDEARDVELVVEVVVVPARPRRQGVEDRIE